MYGCNKIKLKINFCFFFQRIVSKDVQRKMVLAEPCGYEVKASLRARIITSFT